MSNNFCAYCSLAGGVWRMASHPSSAPLGVEVGAHPSPHASRVEAPPNNGDQSSLTAAGAW
eukprot:2003515-Amphidinium_carterae.1